MLTTAKEPAIKMTASDVEGLWSLAEANLHGNPELAEILIGEITRATLVGAEVARDVVTMNSWVEFRYGLTNQTRKVQLVYPAQANISAGKISVMTPIGTALIGLSEGQSIEWRAPQSGKRSLTVLKVHPQSLSNEGNIHV
jgi:regulator of nucleoside diphosphate kinase